MPSSAATAAAPVAPVSAAAEAPGLGRGKLAILAAGVFLAGIDANIVNTALPAIGRSLEAGAQASWAVSAFMLALAVCTPLFGKLSDIHGRRPMMLVAVAIFTVASLLCGIAGNMFELAGGRALQGAGMSGMAILASITVADHVPPRARSRYQAIFMSAYAIAGLTGPFVGGVLTQLLGWRWIFLINPPLGLAMLAAILRFWPAETPAGQTRRPIDYGGAALLVAAAGLAMAALGMIGQHGAGPAIGATAGGALLAFVLLLRIERHVSEPFLPLDMIRRPLFLNAVGISAMVAFPFFGSIVFLPLYLQLGRGVSPMMSGLALGPQVVGLVASSWAASWIVRRGGSFAVCVLVGVGLVAAGLALIGLAALRRDSLWLLEAAVLVLGLGGGMVRPNLIGIVQQAVPPADVGIATATLTFLHTLAGAAGVSISGAVLCAQVARLTARAGLDVTAAHRPETMQIYGHVVGLIFLGGGLLALGSVALALRLLRRGEQA